VKNASESGDLRGLVKIPGFEGVFIGNQFVPVGGNAMNGNLDSVGDGKAEISGPSGKSSVDINAERQRKIESLSIRIE
jgi:hypothetical protein